MSDYTPTEHTNQKPEKPKCGIIMPISEIDGMSKSHWAEVLSIHTQGIEDAGFQADLVSNAEEVGIIQKTIIQNLYENPIVVCDVSAKNPNVMFELGMRLAFDKPTIIVKDDKTTYSFDTAQIEHLNYPRDLRFSQIVDFKTLLADKVKGTYKKSTEDKNYTTFLKNFGEFKVAKIDQTEVTAQEFILDELKSLRASMSKLERSNRFGPLATSLANRKQSLVIGFDSPISEADRFILIELLTGQFGDRFNLELPSLKRLRISYEGALSPEDLERLRSIIISVGPTPTLLTVESDADINLRSLAAGW